MIGFEFQRNWCCNISEALDLISEIASGFIQNIHHKFNFKMDFKLIFLFLLITLNQSRGQHEDIPYQSVENICGTCVCFTSQDVHNRVHYILSCIRKNFNHILPRWPNAFRNNPNGVDIDASFSGNKIEILQQLPASNATLSFSCRYCELKRIQAPAFMDVPNIQRLDLSWNSLSSEELTPDVFRGPFKEPAYQPIALIDLNLSHNLLKKLDGSLFKHTPLLKKLNLSNNALQNFDPETTEALTNVRSLEILDLSHTGIDMIPSTVFSNLPHLKSLHLVGNQFKSMPGQIHLVGKTLEILNLSENPITSFSEESFLGLKVLRRLNISQLNSLETIENGTFALMETLEYLHCANNSNLKTFDLTSLLHCRNLIQLDISNCAITYVTLGMDLSEMVASNETTIPLESPWPKLREFNTEGNPWICDCELFETLQFMRVLHQNSETETRCDAPYVLAGVPFSNLTVSHVCSLQLPKKFRVIEEDTPRFLRKRYVILTAITASIVIIVGVLIGFMVVCIRRRLKRNDFGVEPVRYTSVRSSNISAFSHNGNAQHA